MPGPMLRMPTTNQVNRTVVADHQGRPILVLTGGEYMVHEQDGSITVRKEGHSIELMDGTAWYPAMSAGPQGVKLGCCELCRHPPYRFPFRELPRHGLVSKWKRCARCGQLVCPRHRRPGADGKWRCVRCKRMAWLDWLKEAVLGFFFSTEED